MPEVELTKVVSVIFLADKIKQSINIDFIPDELIIRSICYHNNGAEQFVGYITSDIIDNNVIGTFADSPVAHCPGTRFILKKPIRGSYAFTMFDSIGDLYNLNGPMIIILEFVKYKQKGKIL